MPFKEDSRNRPFHYVIVKHDHARGLPKYFCHDNGLVGHFVYQSEYAMKYKSDEEAAEKIVGLNWKGCSIEIIRSINLNISEQSKNSFRITWNKNTRPEKEPKPDLMIRNRELRRDYLISAL